MPPQLSVSPPVEGPNAPWATLNDAVAFGFTTRAEDIDPDTFDLCAQVASEFLYRKSGLQWPGIATQTIRPVSHQWLSRRPFDWWDTYGYAWIPDLVDGVWWNLGGPDSLGGSWFSCYGDGYHLPTVDLGAYPVTAIMSVKIDGVEQDPAIYRLDNWHQLVRVDGSRWPYRQDLLAADDQPGAFSIQFQWGAQPPRAGVMAAAELTIEMVKHADPNFQTQLPLRVTSVSRSGVTYNLPDVMALVDKGRTGMYFVDQFLVSVNPHQLQAPPRVVTPDLFGPRRQGSQ